MLERSLTSGPTANRLTELKRLISHFKKEVPRPIDEHGIFWFLNYFNSQKQGLRPHGHYAPTYNPLKKKNL